jgi:hypothetical protein
MVQELILDNNQQNEYNKKQSNIKYYQEHKEKILKYQKEYRSTHSEIVKTKAKEYNAKYYQEHKEELKNYQKEYVKTHAEQVKERNRDHSTKYYNDHKEEMKAGFIKYRKEHKEQMKKMGAEYYRKNKEKLSIEYAKYRETHKEERRLYDIEYKNKNKERAKELNKARYYEYKNKIFDILGYECVNCGERTKKFLTIDHIHNDGAIKRKISKGITTELVYFSKRSWPIDEIKENFQTLCFNCNCGKDRLYITKEPNELDTTHKRQQRLWKQAVSFFGICTCGQDNLRFLTIDHIKNDGAARRKAKEKRGVGLLTAFNKQNWPESLKQDYQILCYNCNCSKHL